MKKLFLSLSLLLGFAGGAAAQGSCALTFTKSGTGANRTYTFSSNATSPVYNLHVSGGNPNVYISSSTNTISPNSSYGGYYYVYAYVSGTGCSDSLFFLDTVTGPMNCPTGIELLAGGTLNLNQYNLNLSASNDLAPGYTRTVLFNYGDGTTGSVANHTYASLPSNIQVTASVSYTHPTQPTCTLKDTTYINASACAGLGNSISYVPPTNATYQFHNTLTGTPGPTGYGASTEWYIKYPIGSTYYSTWGDNNGSNQTFSSNGIYSIIAITTWRDSVFYNSICTTRDTELVNVTTVTNNLSIEVNSYTDSTMLPLPFTPQVKTWLIKKDNVAGTLTAVDSVTSAMVVATSYPWNSHATANFYNILSGTYLVKSHIINQPAGLTTGFLPTYIYNQAYWSNADSFVFTGVTNLSKTNQLLTGTPTSGPGFVGGLISAGANKGTAEGDPVAGITILLRNAQDKVIKMATTGADGKFAFANLAAGTYTVYPEELNFSTTPSDAINVTTAQNSMAVNFKRNTTSKEYVPGAVLGVGTIGTTSFSVSPNPAADKIQISLGKFAGKITATLADVTGQIVLQELITGSNATLSVSQLPAGMYLLQLQNGKEVHTEKVQIQH